MNPEEALLEHGPGRSRIAAFLLSSLSEPTVIKYKAALARLALSCKEEGVSFWDLDECSQDWFLAELGLDLFESGAPRGHFAEMLCALLKINPRLHYKTAWRVLDVWQQRQPPHQAPAAPPEALSAISVLLVCAGRSDLGVLVALCYSGLLRAREGLSLKRRDLVFAPDAAVVILAQTKRGREQRVAFRHPTMRQWLQQYLQGWVGEADDRLFAVSYNAFLKWLRRAADLLGLEWLGLSTHSLRRSGASELSRQGVPLADIIDFGRWSGDRSCREYVRRGEAAIHRARVASSPELQSRLQTWAAQAPNAFFWGKSLDALGLPAVREIGIRPEHVKILEFMFSRSM